MNGPHPQATQGGVEGPLTQQAAAGRQSSLTLCYLHAGREVKGHDESGHWSKT